MKNACPELVRLHPNLMISCWVANSLLLCVCVCVLHSPDANDNTQPDRTNIDLPRVPRGSGARLMGKEGSGMHQIGQRCIFHTHTHTHTQNNILRTCNSNHKYKNEYSNEKKIHLHTVLQLMKLKIELKE